MLSFGLLGGKKGLPAGYVLESADNLAGTGTFDPGTGDDGTVSLSWTDPVGNTAPTLEYLIYKGTTNTLVAVVPAGTLTYEDTDGIDADTAYQYNIKVKDTNKNTSKASLFISVPIPNLTLVTVGAPTETPSYTDGIDIAWSAGTGGSYSAAEYVVRRDTTIIYRGPDLIFTYYFKTRNRDNFNITVTAIDTEGNIGNPSPQLAHEPLSTIADALDARDLESRIQSTSDCFVYGGSVYAEATLDEVAMNYIGHDEEYKSENFEDIWIEGQSEQHSDVDDNHSFLLAVRVRGNGNYVGMRIYNGLLQIYEMVQGSFTKHFEQPTPDSYYKTFRLEVKGTTATVYRAGTKVASATLSRLSVGSVGFIQRTNDVDRPYVANLKAYAPNYKTDGELIYNSNFDDGLNFYDTVTGGTQAQLVNNRNGTVSINAIEAYGSIFTRPLPKVIPGRIYRYFVTTLGSNGDNKISIRVDGTWTSVNIAPGYSGDITVDLAGDVLEEIAVGANNDVNAEITISKISCKLLAQADAIDDATIVPGDTTLTLNWTAPNDNGEAILSYDLFLDGAWFGEVPPTQFTAEMTSLNNGQEYSMDVRAVTAGGQSPASNTPRGTPNGAITFTFVVDDDGKFILDDDGKYVIDGDI